MRGDALVRFRNIKLKNRMTSVFEFVPSEGIEPPSSGSKPDTLSIKLRGQTIFIVL